MDAAAPVRLRPPDARTYPCGVEDGILLGARWDLVALATATVLGVFKPGKARGAARHGALPV